MLKLLNIIIIFSFLLYSCEKSSVGDCFKSTGPITIVERPIIGFHTIVLKDNIDLILNHSDTTKIKIEAGNNLIDAIISEVSDSVLTLMNNNTCNWVRDYNNPIRAYLNMSLIDTLKYRSIGNVINEDTLQKSFIQIDIHEGAGTITLLINTNTTVINLHGGTADVILNGVSKNSYFYQNSFGRINAINLRTNLVYSRNWSSNDLYLFAEDYLSIEIKNIGDVYYRGNPEINATITGTGELIPY
jgi:hypothetical protein